MKIYTMDDGTEYVLESEMSDADKQAFKKFQTLAQVPVPEGLAADDCAHYARDWKRWCESK